MINNNSIDLSVFLKKWRVILAFVLVAFILGFCKASFLSKPVHTYTRVCSVRNTEVFSNDSSSKSSSINDTEVSGYLVGMYSEYLKQSEILSPLADYMNQNAEEDQKITIGTLKSSISAQQVGEFGLMRIVISNENLDLASRISNAVDVYLLPKMSEDLGYAEIKPQGDCLPSTRRVSPIQEGFRYGIIGAVLAALIILAISFLNNKVTDEEELTRKFGIPVLGAIPDPSVRRKGGSHYEKNE